MTTTPKYVDEAVKALQKLQRYTFSRRGFGEERIVKTPMGGYWDASDVVQAITTALSEPRYTVEEFLEHLCELAPDPCACEATRICTYHGVNETVQEVKWHTDNLRAHFEPLKKEGPHGR